MSARRPIPHKDLIRKARMSDVEAIHALVTEFGKRELMLPRSRSELYDSLRDFVVAQVRGRVVGCAALSIVWEGLAEIQSLAVERRHQKHGIGRRLVRACLLEGRRIGVTRVFALTLVPKFFEHLGFGRVAREELPHKIWSDCVKCAKFPDCDELALAIDLLPAPPAKRAPAKRGS